MIGEEDHPELAKLMPYLEKVTHAGDKVNISESINPSGFLPKDEREFKRFWTYNGSLTTPPLLESVVWILFQRPIKVSAKQVKSNILPQKRQFIAVFLHSWKL